MTKIKELLVKVAEKLFLTKARKALQGYKTYILLGIFILSNSQDALVAVQQFIDGSIDLMQLLNQLQVIILALAGVAAKAGIDRKANPPTA